MPMLVANLKSGYSVDYGMLMLGVLICTLPTAIIFLCLQKDVYKRQPQGQRMGRGKPR